MVYIDDLFEDNTQPSDKKEAASPPIDIHHKFSEEAFKRIEKTFDKPKKIVADDTEYLKTIIAAAGKAGAHFQKLLKQYLSIEDSEERGDVRAKLIPAYWNMITELAENTTSSKSNPEKWLYRFGYITSQILNQRQLDVLACVVNERQTNESLYYIDEWLLLVAQEGIGATSSDEVAERKMTIEQRKQAKFQRVSGQLGHKLMIAEKYAHELEQLEYKLRFAIESISEKDFDSTLNNLRHSYSDTQSQSLSQISRTVSEIVTMHRKYKVSRDDYAKLVKDHEGLAELTNINTTKEHNQKLIVQELQIIRQIAKLCVGRTGNHVPFLMGTYYSGSRDEIATRENVNNILAELEYIDAGLFLRTFKELTNRIVPYILLVPCFGDMGICWEPFDRFNRASSKGRVAIPMYPRNLRLAVIAAMGDLRWQVAKEKAGRFWMEEGVTGWYYEFYTRMKFKGDVRLAFIKDYILWIMQESNGTQKLEREVRGIFWRYLPFPQERKDKLRNQGYVYNELYKKDINRAHSSMY